MSASLATPVVAQDAAKTIVAEGLNAIFVAQDQSAVERLFRETYIQHNPAIPTGRAPIVGFLPALRTSGLKLTTHRLIADGDFVVTHNSYDNASQLGGERLVAFDVFRVENGQIAEHWDNIAPEAAANPAGRTQVDGQVAVTDREKTAANKALVADFVQTILVKGDMTRLAGFFAGDAYAQHNSQIGDGLSGLGAALKAMAEKGVTIKYNVVHRVLGEGNFVFVISEGVFAGKPVAFHDLFRVENSKLAEHWDVIADIPAKMAHINGKF